MLLEIADSQSCEAKWKNTLATLDLEQAVLLPGIEEAGGKLLKFKLLPRVASHVRHKTKYLDVQLLAKQGFVFTGNGRFVSGPASTSKEFVFELANTPLAEVAAHARRRGFSQWIVDVFLDHFLASDIRKVEHRYRRGHVSDMYQLID